MQKLIPLLFTLFIEALAEAIRIPHTAGGINHVISILADDDVLYLKNHEKCVSAILSSVASFSSLPQ